MALVTQVTAFQTPNGGMYEDYHTAARVAAADILQELADAPDALLDLSAIDWFSVAEFLQTNKAAVAKLIKGL